MILNSGLDACCTTISGSGSGTIPNEAYPFFCAPFTYAAFGTGSTAPDAADTSLDAQVGSRTQDRGGFSNAYDAGVDPTGNVIWHESTFTRVFSISSNVNATEWGLAPASTGNLSARDLFRADPNDPMSSPITLTLEDGDQLQLVITFRVQADWAYASKSFVITGTDGNDASGTHTGDATVTSGAVTTTTRIQSALRVAWPGGIQGSNYGYPHAILSDQSAAAKSDNLSPAGSSSNVGSPGSLETYTPGDHYRDVVYTFTTSEANGDIYAINIGPSSSATGSTGTENASTGFRFILTNPATLTKASTHRLTLTLRKGIARL